HNGPPQVLREARLVERHRSVAQLVREPPSQRLEIVRAAEQCAEPGALARTMLLAERDLAQHDVEGVRRDPREKVGASLRAAHHLAAQKIAHARYELVCARHVERRIELLWPDELYGSWNQQIHTIDLALRCAPADRGTLDGFVGTAAVVLGHAEATNGPPETPEYFPELHVLGIDPASGYGFVAVEQILVLTEAADRGVAAEAPGVRAD